MDHQAQSNAVAEAEADTEAETEAEAVVADESTAEEVEQKELPKDQQEDVKATEEDGIPSPSKIDTEDKMEEDNDIAPQAETEESDKKDEADPMEVDKDNEEQSKEAEDEEMKHQEETKTEEQQKAKEEETKQIDTSIEQTAEPVKEEEKKEDETDSTKAEAEAEEGKAQEGKPTKMEEDKEEEKKESEEDDPNAIWSPTDFDVLSGRGASVNSHGGNKKFRALCFAHKPHFEAGNHAAKRRIATEIVEAVINDGEARFLKRKSEKGPWFELTKEQAILKASQVMRDYKRPDRILQREMMAANGQARRRVRQIDSTPMLDIPLPAAPSEPLIENPFGVHDHDILCGRGAFVNGHIGNQRLRKLALERKKAFDLGNYTDKRSLANEIVAIIKALDPPGRFLKKSSKKPGDAVKEENDDDAPKEQQSEWEELNDEKAIHKACQVMRDIDRPDRKDREERRAKKKQKMMEKRNTLLDSRKPEDNSERRKKEDEEKESTTIVSEPQETVAETSTEEKAAVEEAVAATEEALDKALDAAETKNKEEVAKAESTVEV